MTTLSTNTIISLIDTRTNNGIINLPKTSDIQNRTILFKDIYGSFNTKSLTLQTQSPDVFEDGATTKTFNDSFTSISLYADSQNSKWLQLYGTQMSYITVSSITGLSSINSSNANFSNLTVTNLTFAPGTGWVNIVALQTVLTSSIQTDTAVLNASSLRGDGSQIYNINAVSTLSLQSTITGLGTLGYISSAGASQAGLTSSIIGLGTVGYISSLSLYSTVRGLGTIGYISSLQFISSLNISAAQLSISTINFIDINNKTQQQLLVSSGVLTLNGQGIGGSGGSGSGGLTLSDYVCGGYLAANQTIVSGADTDVTFSDDFDPRSWYDTGTNRFQPNVGGYYEINYQVFWQNGTVANNQYNIQINKNGNQVGITQTQITTTIGLSQNISKIIYMNGSTDYLKFTVYNGNPVSILIQGGASGAGTFFSAALLTNGSSGEPLTSSITGLGSIGYVSSLSLQSTVRGLGTVGYISSVSTFQPNITSSIIGLGTVGYISSVSTFQPNITSSIIGLGTVGYISSTQLQSTLRGLGSVGYVSSSTLQSSIIGLGTLGYISAASLYSSIQSYNFISTLSLQSSIIGLGTVGYISSTQLQSTVRGLGSVGYVSSSTLQSSIIGLGTLGYISAASLYSSIQSYSFVSTSSLQSTIIGLGTLGYISSAGASQTGLTSSIIGLGTIGYISSVSTIQPNITSSIIGLGTVGYISSVSTFQPNITSSIIGLGTLGYISSTQLQSTVRGLGSVGYISSSTLQSSIIGLGTLGYISAASLYSSIQSYSFVSTSSLQSTIIGLGTLGYISAASLYSSIQSYNFISTLSLQSSIIGLATVGYISSTQLQSTVRGLGSVGYISSSTLQSSIIGLGTIGYISAASLYSSIQSYNFVSTSSLTSSIIGLGTVGYISSTQLQSTVRGLGSVGYISSVSTFQPNITSSIIGLGTVGYISSIDTIQPNITSSIIGLGTLGYLSSFNGSTNFLSSGNAFISSLTVTNLTFAPGTGWVNIVALQTVLTSSIQTDTAVLNASSLQGDGSQIYNLNAISTLSLQSTITGLGTLGYISSAGASQTGLTSSIIGLGTVGYISSTQLQSTVRGLGSVGYISSSTLQSSIIGLGTVGYISAASLYSSIQSYSFVSTFSLTSSIIGLGTVGYISSTQLQSTVRGLGSVGYISSSTLQSSIIGLGTVGYISSVSTFQPNITSSIIGLATVGYISSVSTIQPNITSSIIGLATVGYISSVSTFQPNITSTITGLGTLGYISSASGGLSQPNITSSIIGLGTVGYISSVSTFQPNITSSIIGLGTVGYISSFRSISSLNISSGNIYGNTISSVRLFTSSLNTNTTVTNSIVSLTSTITIQDSLVPSLDNIYDLGASTNTWRHLFVGGGSVYLKNSANVNAVISHTSNNILNINRPLNVQYSSDTNAEPKIVFTTSTNMNTLEIKAEPSGFDNIVGDVFKVTGFIDLNENYIYNATGYFVHDLTSLSNYEFLIYSNVSPVNPGVNYPIYASFDSLYNFVTASAIAADWAAFPALNNVDINSNVLENVNQLNVNYIYGNGMGAIVTFGTTVDMYTNEISNVAQTANTNSAATNIIARRVYFDTPTDFLIDNTTYSNVLTTSPTTPITFIYPTAFYTYLNCTISFRCDGANDSLAYYLALFNSSALSELSGEIFNRYYPYIENGNKILTLNHSITFQEQFNITTWTNGDTIVPMLYVITDTGSHTLSNMKFSMVYEPLLP